MRDGWRKEGRGETRREKEEEVEIKRRGKLKKGSKRGRGGFKNVEGKLKGNKKSVDLIVRKQEKERERKIEMS